jgi:prolyl oligopeptidase
MNAAIVSDLQNTDVVVDTYHGVEVQDPFRWLEEHQSPCTRAWIEEQAHESRCYLDALPGRAKLRERIPELFDQESIGDLHIAGKRIFYLKRSVGEAQAKLYERDGPHGEEKLVLDPASLREGDDLSISIVAISPDEKLLAYGLRTGGQGARRVHILNLETGEPLPDELPKGALRGFSFLPKSQGFLYVTEEIGRPTEPKAAKIHYLGNSFDRDKTVFYGGKSSKMRLLSGFDWKSCTAVHTVMRTMRGENLYSTYLQKLCLCGEPLLPLYEDQSNSWSVSISGEDLYVFFDPQDGAGSRLVRVPLDAPNVSQAPAILVEGAHRIQTWRIFGERILTLSVEDIASVLRIYSLDGNLLGAVDLPEPGTASILAGDERGFFFTFESYARPAEVYHYDFASSTRTLFGEAAKRLDPVQVRRMMYPSNDGTEIPLTVLGTESTFGKGSAPVLLTAYGAAGISLTPRFSPLATCFMELGGLFAIAHVRGGGELGHAWEEAGKRHNRPTVHQDFIAAAEYLAFSQMADRKRIAIAGGSNSGLLVGTAMTQRPDLFRAVLCVAPFLDMLRYHRFDNTQFYVPQFGSAEDPDDFPVLLSYSPYHNLREGVQYPALLMVSGDADTRCDPMHARKFVARLQAAQTMLPQAQRAPALLDWNPLRGHFATLPLSVRVEAIVDRLAFLCRQLNMEVA